VIAQLAVDPVVQRALAAGAALLFLSASVHKLRDGAAFRAALAAYGVLPRGALPAVARAIPLAELGVALTCLAPGGGAIGCLAGATLLAVYSGAIAFNLARGRRAIDCGCGGLVGDQPLSTGLLARNAGLFGLLVLAALPESPRPLVWLDAVSTGGLLLALGAFHVALDVALANAARLRPGRGAA